MLEQYLAADPTEIEILANGLPSHHRREAQTLVRSWQAEWDKASTGLPTRCVQSG